MSEHINKRRSIPSGADGAASATVLERGMQTPGGNERNYVGLATSKSGRNNCRRFREDSDALANMLSCFLLSFLILRARFFTMQFLKTFICFVSQTITNWISGLRLSNLNHSNFSLDKRSVSFLICPLQVVQDSLGQNISEFLFVEIVIVNFETLRNKAKQ